MSALIKEGKMSFSVFGRGYDDVRADSGEGAIEDYNRYGMGISNGCFDVTGQYLWLACYGNGHTAGLLKFDMDDDFNELSHTVPTSANDLLLFHGSNVANNYGLAIQGSDWYVFDLTDDTVIASGSDAILNNISWATNPFDCVLDGTTFRICTYRTQNSSPTVYSLDYSDGTVTSLQIGANRCGGVFLTESLIYEFYTPQWFYQNYYIESTTPSGSAVWGYQALQGGISPYPVNLNGFGKKGNLYIPSNVYASWRLCEYPAKGTPKIFETPKPKNLIGKFPSQPTINRFAFTHEKERVAFTTNIGVFVSDFEEMERISESNEIVYAVSDNYVVVDKGYMDSSHPSSIGIYKYR